MYRNIIALVVLVLVALSLVACGAPALEQLGVNRLGSQKDHSVVGCQQVSLVHETDLRRWTQKEEQENRARWLSQRTKSECRYVGPGIHGPHYACDDWHFYVQQDCQIANDDSRVCVHCFSEPKWIGIYSEKKDAYVEFQLK